MCKIFAVRTSRLELHHRSYKGSLSNILALAELCTDSVVERGLYVVPPSFLSPLLRLWQGLLDTIARVEEMKDLKDMLVDSSTEYRIVDLDFRSVDRKRWHEKVVPISTGPKIINVRLIKLTEDSLLTLDFAERKLREHVHATFALLVSNVVLDNLRARMTNLRRRKYQQQELEKLKLRIKRISEMVTEITRRRDHHRWLLYVARFHLCDPHRRRVYIDREPAAVTAPVQTTDHDGSINGGPIAVRVQLPSSIVRCCADVSFSLSATRSTAQWQSEFTCYKTPDRDTKTSQSV